jgi:hypothetical protein
MMMVDKTELYYRGGVMMKAVTMTFEEWLSKYKPINNHLDSNASFQDEAGNGIMFETFGMDLEYVLSIANTEPQRVWTYMDGDTGTFVGDGYHLVNRIGYFITEVPCEMDTFIEAQVDTYEEYDE